jgi:ferredoxin
MNQFQEARKLSGKVRKHPLNAEGKYYVDQNSCFWCAACVNSAPRNFVLATDNFELGAYVLKQPETPEEEAQCREAVTGCPHEAVLTDEK